VSSASGLAERTTGERIANERIASERTVTAVRSSFLRTIFSFPVMLASLLTVLAVLTVRDRFSDPDMWWHLRTGQIIWNTHTIPTTDLFSWTTNHHAWVPHEWLSQVIIYGAYRFGGYSGLMLFLCVCTAALLIAGYILCTLYSGNAKIALLGALIIWFFATSGLSIRPQLIGYLLLILELLIFQLGSTRSPRWFFWLPPLFAVWVNSHGSFFLGFLIAFLLFACSYVRFEITGLRPFLWTARARRNCGFALVFSTAAMFLNPTGLKLILYPLDMMFKQPINVGNVQEWQPLVFTSPRGAGLFLILVCIALLVICRRAELFPHEVLLLALGTWLALSHQRMVFVLGILAAPPLSRLCAQAWDEYDAERDHPIANGILIAASLLLAIVAFPSSIALVKQVDKQNPAKAVEFINTHRFSGHMLNEWTYGGYLIWAAPNHPTFIDGRGDIFEETGVLKDFAAWAKLESDPHVLLDKYPIDFCLLARGSPMSHVLPLLPGWKTAYSDDTAIVFVRDRSH
jgi:hypothetical protein